MCRIEHHEAPTQEWTYGASLDVLTAPYGCEICRPMIQGFSENESGQICRGWYENEQMHQEWRGNGRNDKVVCLLGETGSGKSSFVGELTKRSSRWCDGRDRNFQTIRLLNLCPGSGEETLRCKVTIESLDEEPQYDALSYTWGYPRDDEVHSTLNWTPSDFEENNDCNNHAKEMHISSDLHHILRTLRRPAQNRYLWIDSICIDQKDPEERQSQVAIMDKIYRRAENIFVWSRCEAETPTRDPDVAFDRALRTSRMNWETAFPRDTYPQIIGQRHSSLYGNRHKDLERHIYTQHSHISKTTRRTLTAGVLLLSPYLIHTIDRYLRAALRTNTRPSPPLTLLASNVRGSGFTLANIAKQLNLDIAGASGGPSSEIFIFESVALAVMLTTQWQMSEHHRYSVWLWAASCVAFCCIVSALGWGRPSETISMVPWFAYFAVLASEVHTMVTSIGTNSHSKGVSNEAPWPIEAKLAPGDENSGHDGNN